jgi:hypothetical protein
MPENNDCERVEDLPPILKDDRGRSYLVRGYIEAARGDARVEARREAGQAILKSGIELCVELAGPDRTANLLIREWLMRYASTPQYLAEAEKFINNLRENFTKSSVKGFEP